MTDTARDQHQGNLGPDQHQGNRPEERQTPDTGAQKNQNPDQPRNREQGDTVRKDDRQGIDPDTSTTDSPRQAG